MRDNMNMQIPKSEEFNLQNHMEHTAKDCTNKIIENKNIENKSKNDANIKVIIAAHKPYRMPEDSMYLPLHVGAEGKDLIGYQPDNTGENISDKNSSYCELTGLYWAWKNLECDYLGLVHYRRYFAGYGIFRSDENGKITKEEQLQNEKFAKILTQSEAEKLLQKADILVPKKRNYYIETLYSHYSHTHDASQLDMTRKIIEDKYPQDVVNFDKVMNSRGGYMFNMFIMSKELVDEYCQWLFDILDELEAQMDVSELSAFQGRLYGRVSELLFNVWLMRKKNQGMKVQEVPCMHMEPINWWKKGTAFLKAKFVGKKYEGSF